MLSMKPIRKALASPGRSKGKVTVRKIVRRPARSVCAASSSVGVMPCTTPISTRKAIGVKASVWAMKMPGSP